MSEEPKIYSLSGVATGIQNALRDATSKTIWVRAEVSSGGVRGGSFYCDLVETDQQGNLTTKLRGTAWARSLKSIQGKFANHGVDFPPPNGTSVVLFCRLNYHPVYGLSLTIVDADPLFSLGDIEQRRRETLETLKREGLFETNRKLIVPTLPIRVGLVTSQGSAAYNDFVQTLRQSGFPFQVFAADATVQGEKTETSVIRALNRVSLLKCDVVALIRGGGSKTDLAGFDSEAIAREISSFPVPVFVGLGHEIDNPVANYVAGQAFVTPTAVAEDLVERCAQVDRFLEEAIERFKSVCTSRIEAGVISVDRAAERIQSRVEQRLAQARRYLSSQTTSRFMKVNSRLSTESSRLMECGRQLHRAGLANVESRRRSITDKRLALQSQAKHCLNQNQRDLEHSAQRFNVGKLLQRISTEEERLETKETIIRAQDPTRMLDRGFALLKDPSGNIITSVNNRSAGDRAAVFLKDGRLDVSVTNICRKESI